MESVRSFIAIELPDTVRSILSQLQNELKRSELSFIKWVNPTGIHLTLKFLGNISVDSIPEISRAISETAGKTAHFSLELGEPGAFPSLHNPRVLWVGLRGDIASLSALQKEIERALIPLGFPPEKKVFSPHLTLGRIREKLSPTNRNRLEEITASLKVTSPSLFTADSISFIKSTLTREGAIYNRLHLANLGGK